MTRRKAILPVCWAALSLLRVNELRAEDLTLGDLWTDTKLYFTSPLRWDTEDWLFFGGAVAAVGAAHEFDGKVRDHFAGSTPVLNGGKDPHALRDAAPAAIATFATWAIAELSDSSAGKVEAWTMLEA